MSNTATSAIERVYLREGSGAFIRPSFPAPNIPLAAISTYKVYLNIGTMQCVSPGGGAGWGKVLRISSDRDDRRIFWGKKI